jgi:hypothetical protein
MHDRRDDVAARMPGLSRLRSDAGYRNGLARRRRSEERCHVVGLRLHGRGWRCRCWRWLMVGCILHRVSSGDVGGVVGWRGHECLRLPAGRARSEGRHGQRWVGCVSDRRDRVHLRATDLRRGAAHVRAGADRWSAADRQAEGRLRAGARLRAAAHRRRGRRCGVGGGGRASRDSPAGRALDLRPLQHWWRRPVPQRRPEAGAALPDGRQLSPRGRIRDTGGR